MGSKRGSRVGVCLIIVGTMALGTRGVQSQQDSIRRQRFTHNGLIDREDNVAARVPAASIAEAPTGFDNKTNGLVIQGPDFDTLNEDNVVPLRSFNDDRFIFEEVETVEDGLGPTYNAQSCRECHQNVATGGASQVAEHRTGRIINGQFEESLGGSLLQSRATHPEMMELVPYDSNVRTFRISTNTLGLGFVESIANATLLAIRDGQPLAIRGTAVVVPILEADGTGRIGRFGWKAQHASLESFAADAYINEMGVTSPLLPEENTSAGRSVADYDHVADPEDDGVDVKAFAEFMRATKAPSRGPRTAAVRTGEEVFERIGCANCHVTSITTARPGTVVNGGAFVVPAALGNKVIHPYSDFLLHDVGTGDGIPILATPEYAHTANKMRTAPLWALRTRNRLMHDGLAFTKEEAILRHEKQGKGAKNAYLSLSSAQRLALFAFLDSL